ncbi:MAG: hypothetical protein JRI72_00560 [Deltaproteobacteria bacterium]|nr:hypothetical protein [Deltaproteobacteria bacterium]
MKPKGKCFAKKCEDCNWWQPWDITEVDTGLRKVEYKCSIQVMCESLPKLVGSIDGLQGGINEARNRSIEAKAAAENFGNGVLQLIKSMGFKIIDERNHDVHQVSRIKIIGQS